MLRCVATQQSEEGGFANMVEKFTETFEERVTRVAKSMANGDQKVIDALSDPRMRGLQIGVNDSTAECYPMPGLDGSEGTRDDDEQYNDMLSGVKEGTCALRFTLAVVIAYCPKNVVDTLCEYHTEL